jgi:hypothetical protein
MCSQPKLNLREHSRMTKAETQLAERMWAIHAGDEERLVRHYPNANRVSNPLGFTQFRKQPHVRFAQATRADADGERDKKNPKPVQAEAEEESGREHRPPWPWP